MKQSKSKPIKLINFLNWLGLLVCVAALPAGWPAHSAIQIKFQFYLMEEWWAAAPFNNSINNNIQQQSINKLNFFNLVELIGWCWLMNLLMEQAAGSKPAINNHQSSIQIENLIDLIDWFVDCGCCSAPSSFIHKLIPLISSFCLRAGPQRPSTLFLFINQPILKSWLKERKELNGQRHLVDCAKNKSK